MNIFRRNRPSEYEHFSANLKTKTRKELVMLTESLRRGTAHPGMVRAAEKALARMDGFRGA